MVVGVLQLELQLYSPQSLKEKRSIVRSLLGRCRERFPVSCCESGLQDSWQRAELSCVTVAAGTAADVEVIFAKIEVEIERSGAAEICLRHSEILHY
jgi:uncharacterized protein YlxP (DUF503 family)